MKDKDFGILQKIVRYCDEIKHTHSYFQNNRDLFMDRENGFVYRNSITMPILQIGELSKKLSEECRKEIQNVPWKEITGIRDFFAHHYGSIDYDIVWNTSKEDIENLLSAIENVL